MLLSGEIFSNISIKENVHGLILPLHPKYGILIVPTEYYQQQNKIRLQGKQKAQFETKHKTNFQQAPV